MSFLARKTHSQLVLVVFDYCSYHLDIPMSAQMFFFIIYILLQQCMKKRLKLKNLQYIHIFWIWYIRPTTISKCFQKKRWFFSLYFDLCKLCQPKKTQPGTASLAIVGSILELDGWRRMRLVVIFFLLVTFYPVTPFFKIFV